MHPYVHAFNCLTTILFIYYLLFSGRTLLNLHFSSQRRSYNIGQNVALECLAETYSDITARPFTWFKDSVAITGESGDSRFSVTQFPTSTRLVIYNFRAEDAGDYLCSRPGFTNITATLNVTVPGFCVVHAVEPPK